MSSKEVSTTSSTSWNGASFSCLDCHRFLLPHCQRIFAAVCRLTDDFSCYTCHIFLSFLVSEMIILVILCYRIFTVNTSHTCRLFSYLSVTVFAAILSATFAVLLSVLLAIVATFFCLFLVSSLSTPSTHWQSQLPRYLISITAAFVEPVSAVHYLNVFIDSDHTCLKNRVALLCCLMTTSPDTSPTTASVLLWCCSCNLDSTTENFILAKLPAYLQRRFSPYLTLSFEWWTCDTSLVTSSRMSQHHQRSRHIESARYDAVIPESTRSFQVCQEVDVCSCHLLVPSNHMTPIAHHSYPVAVFVGCAWSCSIIHLNFRQPLTRLKCSSVLIHHIDRRMVANTMLWNKSTFWIWKGP